MDYKNIYESYMRSFQQTSPRERLEKRNPLDERLEKEYLYTENHHILPGALGGKNTKENMVLLLPEEHLWAHEIRYKAYKNPCDMLAVRFVMNGFNSSWKNRYFSGNKTLNKRIRKISSFIKQNSAEMRKVKGWQTEDGLKRISESRKGTMPVMDAETKEMIGSVSVNHPNVISGKWVHHSKGKITVLEISTNTKVRLSMEEFTENRALYKTLVNNKGLNNPRSLGLTEEQKQEEFKKFCTDLGMVVSFGFLTKVCLIPNSPYKRVAKLCFRNKSLMEFYKEISEELNLPLMVKTSYSKEEKEKYFEGLIPGEFISKKFNINLSKGK